MVNLTENIINDMFKNKYDKVYIKCNDKLYTVDSPTILKYKLCECVLNSKYNNYDIENLIVIHQPYILDTEKIKISDHIMTVNLMTNYQKFIKNVVIPYSNNKDLYIDSFILRKFKSIIKEELEKGNIYIKNTKKELSINYCAKNFALELFNKVIG